ncbi:MAG: SgcJ/EcaC family oxidoreductase [Balneolaceae bacterium]
MHNSSFNHLILLPLLLFTGCNDSQQSQQVNHPADIEAIEQMSANRAAAFNQGNAADIAVHFTEDGILMAPGAPASSGRDAVEAYYQQIFDQYETELESYYEQVAVSGDLAFGQGIAEVILTPKNGGETISSTSKYINILQRQPDGVWLTTHDIWNENE